MSNHKKKVEPEKHTAGSPAKGTHRKTMDTSLGDKSAEKSGGHENSVTSRIPKPLTVKDERTAKTVKPIRSAADARPLPGAKGADKNPKGKKALAKETKEKKTEKKAKKKSQRSSWEKFLISLGFSVGKVTLTDPKAVEAANALRLRPWHLRRLKQKFDSIDIDGSGNIDADEFFEAVGEQRTPFTDKLFAMIDLDGSGTIEFDEFVRVLATYCMFSQEEILRFCFECFDVDGSGSIDEREFIELCKTVNNASPTFPANFKNALEQFDVNEDGLIDYHEFLEIDRRFPMVLFPAFRLQDYMQKNTLGEKTWLKIVEEFHQHKQIEEYKALHGGRAPPDPIFTKIGKSIMPCFYREREFIKLGYQ